MIHTGAYGSKNSQIIYTPSVAHRTNCRTFRVLSSSSGTDRSVVVVLLEFRREAAQIKAFSVKICFRDSQGLDFNAITSRLLNNDGVFGRKLAGRGKSLLRADISVAVIVAIFRLLKGPAPPKLLQ